MGLLRAGVAAVCYRCLGASRIPAASCNYLVCCCTSVISISCCSRPLAAESHVGCCQCLPCTHSSQQQQQQASAQRGCQCASQRRVKECYCSWWVTAAVSLGAGWGLAQQLHRSPDRCFCKHWSWGLQLPLHDTDQTHSLQSMPMTAGWVLSGFGIGPSEPLARPACLAQLPPEARPAAD